MSQAAEIDTVEPVEAGARRKRAGLNISGEESCNACNGESTNLMIYCDNCKFWIHYSCAKVTQALTDQIENYYCNKCIKEDGLIIKWRKLENRLKEKQHEVEKIVRYEWREGFRFFRIAWVGYGIKDRSWEPEVNLAGAIDMLQEFLRKKNEPYSTVVGLMGSSDECENVNRDNWMSMEQVIEKFNILRPRCFPDVCMIGQEYIDTFQNTGIYFLRFSGHCYTILYDDEKKLATIADGTNNFKTNTVTAEYIYSLLQVRIRSVYYDQQKYVDYCGTSAILIGLELVRAWKDNYMPTQLRTSKRMRDRLIQQFHIAPSILSDHVTQRRSYLCICGQAYRYNQRKQFMQHFRMCREVAKSMEKKPAKLVSNC